MIANSAGAGPRVVTVDPSDALFVSQDCGTWSSDLDTPRGPIGDGVWIVGVDIMPGRYENSAESDACIWERLSGFGGTPEDSVAAGMASEPTLVEIEATDAGFSSSRCGEWTRAS